eukprot:CAMPEP_0118973512 /NCGR_PEP_ID=MMETSP1173-20130426/10322_1 /TAXON_ID=1034831 /ORGANISM="Rhizochromulina marina cf, Strain CCMP1243" /LENGTH=127 /DNA_ID=CAMNT_0006923185 /DNA_START=27 /DNA_END=410 /DNA_ORIENTATION=+
MFARRLASLASRPVRLPRARGMGAKTAAEEPQQAFLFGIKPGTYKPEGWEDITVGFYIASFALLVVGLSNRPQTGFREWALDEARTRREREDGGLQSKWGEHYGGLAKFTYEREEIGEPPVIQAPEE